MELSQLFTHGSKLSDVPPDFKGMPMKEWRAKEMTVQCDKWHGSQKRKGIEPPINKTGIQHPSKAIQATD
jgi:hypothetical protein